MKKVFIIIPRDSKQEAITTILDLADKGIGSYCFEGSVERLADHIGENISK